MLRRTAPASVSLVFKQLELTTPLTVKDKPVNSWSDEFLKPPVSKEMESKYGRYAKYSDPALSKVDTSDEVVLNTYPEGTKQGRIEVTRPLKEFDACMWDEKFFRKNILKPKIPDSQMDKGRVTDYALNSVLLGFAIYIARYVLLPVWYVGQPRMSMVAMMNIEAEIGEMEDKQCKTVVWRGKPIDVYKRSAKQMKDVQDVPVGIDSPPKPEFSSIDRDHDLIEMPLVVGGGPLPFHALREV